MTGSNYFAGVYWAARCESAEACAQRMTTLLRLLATCHPELAQWYQQADSLEEAVQRAFVPDTEVLLRMIDTEGGYNGPLGFSFGVWTGHLEEGHGTGIRVTCGSSLPDASPNLCLLSLPWPETPSGQQLLSRTVLTRVMRALVIAWDPDWGVIVSESVRDQLELPRLVGTYMGWLTYITRRRGKVPALSDVLSIESVEDKGSLVVLTDDPLETIPEHLELSRRVQQQLSAGGLLRKI